MSVAAGFSILGLTGDRTGGEKENEWPIRFIHSGVDWGVRVAGT